MYTWCKHQFLTVWHVCLFPCWNVCVALVRQYGPYHTTYIYSVSCIICIQCTPQPLMARHPVGLWGYVLSNRLLHIDAWVLLCTARMLCTFPRKQGPGPFGVNDCSQNGGRISSHLACNWVKGRAECSVHLWSDIAHSEQIRGQWWWNVHPSCCEWPLWTAGNCTIKVSQVEWDGYTYVQCKLQYIQMRSDNASQLVVSLNSSALILYSIAKYRYILCNCPSASEDKTTPPADPGAIADTSGVRNSSIRCYNICCVANTA